ncbi:hypothetical protein [Actinomadura hibisca]|uniref:hypothetical protein n=1 Tax=Actinomadura hibisca TaxID=68565 RepID=UPI000833CB02|nr:hypothetical protein [Actinomadura hibisca]
MDAQQAHRALQEIHDREQQTLAAAYPRLPWWAYLNRFLFFVALGIMGDLGTYSGKPVLFAVPLAILLAYGFVEGLVERRTGVRHRLGRHPRPGAAVINVVEVAVLLAVYIGVIVLTWLLDLPVHSTLAGIAAGVAAVGTMYWFQPARYVERSRR